MKTSKVCWIVEAFNDGASAPERVWGPFRSREDADKHADYLRVQCAARGWAKEIRVTKQEV